MGELKSCPLCGEKLAITKVHLCGGVPTLIHTCVNDIEIKVRADTNHDVIRKWNAFVTVVNRR